MKRHVLLLILSAILLVQPTAVSGEGYRPAFEGSGSGTAIIESGETWTYPIIALEDSEVNIEWHSRSTPVIFFVVHYDHYDEGGPINQQMCLVYEEAQSSVFEFVAPREGDWCFGLENNYPDSVSVDYEWTAERDDFRPVFAGSTALVIAVIFIGGVAYYWMKQRKSVLE